MSTVRSALAVCMLGLITAAPLAKADSAANAKKAIVMNYAQDDAAFCRKDVNGFFAHTSPDYVAIDKKGKKTPIQALRGPIQLYMPIAATAIAKTTIRKVAVKGNKAYVTVSRHLALVGKAQQGMAPANISLDTASVDTWVKAPTGWLKKLSSVLAQTSKK